MEAVTVIGITPVKRPSLKNWLIAAREKQKPLEELISDLNTGSISDTEAYNALTFMRETGQYQGIGMGCFVIPLVGLLGAVPGLIYDNSITMTLGAIAGVVGGVAASYRLTRTNLNGNYLPVNTGHVDSLIAYLERTGFSEEVVIVPGHKIIPMRSDQEDRLLTTHLMHKRHCQKQPRKIPFGDFAFLGTPQIIHEDFYEIKEENSYLSIRVITGRKPAASVRATQEVEGMLTYVLPKESGMGWQQNDTHWDIYGPRTFTRPLKFERNSFDIYSRAVKPYFTFQTA